MQADTPGAQTAFIFDMDGTLVDNMSFHERTWLDLLADRGLTVTAEEFHRRAAGRTNPDIFREFLGETVTDEEAAEWGERKEALYREAYRPHLRPIPGLHQFLQQAGRLGVPMALATSGGPANIEFVLQGLEIAPHFRAVVSGDEVRRGKPDPEMFLLAAERLGIAPERCVVFEDSSAGIEAAVRAGMRVIVLATGLSAAELEDRPGVEAVVEDYTAIQPEGLLGVTR